MTCPRGFGDPQNSSGGANGAIANSSGKPILKRGRSLPDQGLEFGTRIIAGVDWALDYRTIAAGVKPCRHRALFSIEFRP
jgi:hypothetical protein